MTEAKFDQCTQFFVLSERERRPLAEVADLMGITVYAARQLKQDPDYKTVRAQQLADLQDQHETRTIDLAHASIQTLEQLMLGAKSEFVRFQAAQALLTYTGLGTRHTETETDDRAQLPDFLQQLMQRQKVTVTIEPPTSAADPVIVESTPNAYPVVQDGGLLPPFAGAIDLSSHS